MSKLDLKFHRRTKTNFESERAKSPGGDSSCTECNNSFLQEISFNTDIDSIIRQEIEAKFKKSKVNANYVFPRNLKGLAQKLSPNHVIRSNSRSRNTRKKLTLEKSLPLIQKNNKSIAEAPSIYSSLPTKDSVKKM